MGPSCVPLRSRCHLPGGPASPQGGRAKAGTVDGTSAHRRHVRVLVIRGRRNWFFLLDLLTSSCTDTEWEVSQPYGQLLMILYTSIDDKIAVTGRKEVLFEEAAVEYETFAGVAAMKMSLAHFHASDEAWGVQCHRSSLSACRDTAEPQPCLLLAALWGHSVASSSR